jgi:hypothetical protein
VATSTWRMPTSRLGALSWQGAPALCGRATRGPPGRRSSLGRSERRTRRRPRQRRTSAEACGIDIIRVFVARVARRWLARRTPVGGARARGSRSTPERHRRQHTRTRGHTMAAGSTKPIPTPASPHGANTPRQSGGAPRPPPEPSVLSAAPRAPPRRCCTVRRLTWSGRAHLSRRRCSPATRAAPSRQNGTAAASAGRAGPSRTGARRASALRARPIPGSPARSPAVSALSPRARLDMDRWIDEGGTLPSEAAAAYPGACASAFGNVRVPGQ